MLMNDWIGRRRSNFLQLSDGRGNRGGGVISAANGRQMVLAAAHPINTDTWNHFRESAASGVACQLASPGVANSLEKRDYNNKNK